MRKKSRNISREAPPASGRRPAQILIAIDSTAAYQRQMLRGIIAYVNTHNPDWEFLFNHRPEPLDFKMRIHKRIDGVLLHEMWSPTISRDPTRQLNRDSVRLLKKAAAPVVLIEQRASEFPMVLSDNIAIGNMAFQYLRNKGFQNYAFYERTTLWIFQERRQAFAAAVRQDGRQWLELPARLVDFTRPPSVLREELGRWLARAPKPLALFIGGIIPARQAVLACRNAGVAVPDEVAILGVGHDEIDCGMVRPSISAINHGMDRAGFEAAALLHRMMEGHPPPPDPLLIPPVGVTERQSTDILAVEDGDVRAAIRWIRDHAVAGAGIGDMLRQLPVSRRRLEIAFRRHLGRTIHEEIQRVRLEKARYLLLNSRMSVPQIATQCGFNYPSRLAELFKRATGMTPVRFRHQFKTETISDSDIHSAIGFQNVQ